jgi:hypothetical protein
MPTTTVGAAGTEADRYFRRTNLEPPHREATRGDTLNSPSG